MGRFLLSRMKINNFDIVSILKVRFVSMFSGLKRVEMAQKVRIEFNKLPIKRNLSPNPILMYNGGGLGSQSAIGIFTIFHISAVHQLWIWTK